MILYELGKRMKSRGGRLFLSSAELGDYLGISQQSASRYLIELERGGFIERGRSGRRQQVKFTEKGLGVLEGVYLNLRDFIEEGGEELLIEGRVASGLGEGAYYIREYRDRLEKHTGFLPFCGTLNIKPLKPYPCMEKYIAGTVKGFEKDGRTFGEVGYTHVTLIGENWKENCCLIIPWRTHHTGELEIISRRNLREKHKLKDGDLIKIKIERR